MLNITTEELSERRNKIAYVIMTALELRKKGMTVKVKEYEINEFREDMKIEDLEPYLPEKYWKNLEIDIQNQSQQNNMFKTVENLFMAGYDFDIHGTKNKIIWTLDWSFLYQKGSDHPEEREALKELKQIINNK